MIMFQVNRELKKRIKLNGICPYYTMFPLEFPYSILRRYALKGEWVFDPFCGRGTTNYASQILGLPSLGIDSSPVAVAISEAKLTNTSPNLILKAAKEILENFQEPKDVPIGEFWNWAYDANVLRIICRLREGLIKDCHSDDRKALRGILLGALHGPKVKSYPSYLSNQSLRTYAPKPNYAVNFWKKRNLHPESVDVLKLIQIRADRYFSEEKEIAEGKIIKGDSRDTNTYYNINQKFRWVITSPPYYGMKTYIPDQWLRMWFLGGKSTVDYSMEGQLEHPSPELFAMQLNQVWKNVAMVCVPDSTLIIRFGSINDRKVDPLQILYNSLENSGWKVKKVESAGCASAGKRQALYVTTSVDEALEEYDVWAEWNG